MQIRDSKQDYRLRNKRFVWSYLREHPCVDCEEGDPIVLEFDHVRGEKNGAIADMVWIPVGLQKLKDEIAKCEVRCSNCHKRKTFKERNCRMY